MPKVDDIIIPRNIAPQVRDMLEQMTGILNEGGYEIRTYSNAPTAGSAGFNGEERNVITGAVLTVYRYVSGNWYKSDATALSGWSVVT